MHFLNGGHFFLFIQQTREYLLGTGYKKVNKRDITLVFMTAWQEGKQVKPINKHTIINFGKHCRKKNKMLRETKRGTNLK